VKARIVALAAALIAAVAVANAAVFVYYPANVKVVPQQPPIVFDEGTNANQADLLGNTIEVSIAQNKTEVNITVHPTLQYTYYYNILVVNNTDSNAYYVNFYVNFTNFTASFQEAYLVINGQKYLIQNGQFVLSTPLTLNANEYINVSLLFYAPDSQQFQGNVVIDLQLVYSPTTETFQTLP